MLERKIILIKEKFGDIALIMESLVSLLYPLKWNFVFITYLSSRLIECFEAPFPYIIGVSKMIWEDHCMMREMPDDVLIFDIDKQEMIKQSKEELPPLPQPQAGVLLRSLKDLLDMKDRFVEGVQANSDNQMSGIGNEKIEEYYWGYAWLRIKQSFLNFFLLTINNYIGFFKNLDDEGEMSPNMKRKKDNQKLSSTEVFDFDAYMNQFDQMINDFNYSSDPDGHKILELLNNKIFMEKLVKSQSFNNFIEDTYQNTNNKTPIGFFQTNMDVLINYSFKKLKKEQNKLIYSMFFNFQNPIQFSIERMFKIYTKELLKKNQNPSDEIEGVKQLKLESQDEQLKSLLLEELNSQGQQLTLISSINSDFMTEMPGIEYENINIYQHSRRSQRSEQSHERFGSQNWSMMKSGTIDMLSQKRQPDKSIDDQKSRNFNKIQISRSNETRALDNQGENNYKNYLSLADNQKSIQEDDKFFYNNPQVKKQRMNSENSFIKGFGQGQLNKTVVVNNNQSLYRPPTTIQPYNKQASNTQKLELKAQHRVMQSSNNFQHIKTQIDTIKDAGNRKTQSPKLMHSNQQLSMKFNNTTTHHLNNTSSISQNSFLQSPLEKQHQNLILGQQQNRQNPKRVIMDNIIHHRQKHGLQFKQEENQKLNLQTQISPNYLNQPKDIAAFPLSVGSNYSSNNPKCQNASSMNVGLIKHIPNSKIDLMNPGKKKESRNEQRKQAYQKGILRFESHQSFYSFYSPKEEEFKRLMVVQKANAQKEDKNFSNFINQHKHKRSLHNLSQVQDESNKSNQVVDDLLQSNKRQIISSQNQLKFQKKQQKSGVGLEALTRNHQDLHQAEQVQPLVKFRKTFIKPKAQVTQSPSEITNTDLSGGKKGSQLKKNLYGSDDGMEYHEHSPNIMMKKKGIESNNKTVVISPIQHQKDKLKMINKKQEIMFKNHHNLSTSNYLNLSQSMEIVMERQKSTFNQSKPQMSEFKKNLTKTSMDNPNLRLDKQKHQQKLYYDRVQQFEIEIDEEEGSKEEEEDRPLQKQHTIPQQSIQIGIKNTKINNQSESPQPLANIQAKVVTKQKTGLQSQNKSPLNKNEKSIYSSINFQSNGNKSIVYGYQKGNGLQTFDNSSSRIMENGKQKLNNTSTLQRKKSHPMLNSEKTPNIGNKQQVKTNIAKTKTLDSKQPKEKVNQQAKYQKGQYFKQKQMKNLNGKKSLQDKRDLKTLELQMEERSKYSGEVHLDLLSQPSLRISPIPDLSHAIRQRQISKEDYSVENFCSEHMHSNNMNNKNSNRSSQVNLMLSPRSNLITNFNAVSSRGSDNLGNRHKHKDSSLSSQQNMEVEVFGRMSGGEQKQQAHSSRYKNTQLFSTKINQSSQRSSVLINQQQDKERKSDLNEQGKMFQKQRSSGLLDPYSSKISQQAQNILHSNRDIMDYCSANSSNLRQQESQLNNIYYNSLVDSISQAQADGPSNNISISILKTSPRIGQNKNRPPIQQSKGIYQPMQSSLQTSLDLSNINTLVKTFKAGLTHKNMMISQSIDQSQLMSNTSIDNKGLKMVKSPSNQMTQKCSKSKQILAGILEGSSKQKDSQRSNSEENLQKLSRKGKNSNYYSGSHQTEKAKTNILRGKLLQSPKMNSLVKLNSYDVQKSENKNGKGGQYSNLDRMNGNAQSQNSLKKQKAQMQLNEIQEGRIMAFTQKESCKSTKNLRQNNFSHNINNTQQKKLIEELNGYNTSLQKLEDLNQKRSSNILEEVLTSKSHSRKSYSTSSYQISPREGKKVKTVFRSTLNGIDDIREPPTVKNYDMPSKKFDFQNEFNIEGERNEDLESSERKERNYLNLPKQMESDKYVELSRSNSIKGVQKQSLFVKNNNILERTKSVQKEQLYKQQNIPSTLKKNKEEEIKRNSMQLPLYEIKYQNEQNMEANSKSSISSGVCSNKNKRSEELKKGKKQQSQINFESLYQQTTTCHAKKGLITINESSDQLHRQRQMRTHGQTTFLVFPSKESGEYFKREQNQDVFCRINSHQGDTDKDPNSPKSQRSPRSIEKSRRGVESKIIKIHFMSKIEEIPGTAPHRQQIDQPMKNLSLHEHEINTPSRTSSNADVAQAFYNSQSINDLMMEQAPNQQMRKQDSYQLDYETNKYETQQLQEVNNEVIKKIKALQYEILFEDSDLKDTEEKFTSRDVNFSKLNNRFSSE